MKIALYVYGVTDDGINPAVSVYSGMLTIGEPIPDSSPLYRFWSNNKQGHFYTANEAEKDAIIADYDDDEWHYEGIAYNVYLDNSRPGSIVVYRFWSNTKQGHFFTANEAEKDAVIADYDDDVWHYEGEAFYVMPLTSTESDLATVFRFWSNDKQHHFFEVS